jgi:hypothetical protein
MPIIQTHPKIPLVDLADDILFEFTDLSEDLACHYIRRTAREMCRQADLVVHTRVLCIIGGVENYLLEADDDSDIANILDVRGIDLNIGFCSPKVTRLREEPRGIVPGTVSWFTPPNTIYIRQPMGFDGSGKYEVTFSVIPSKNACHLDESFSTIYYEALLDGVKRLIFELAGKPWFSPELSQFYRQRFNTGLMALKSWEMTGRQRGMPRFEHTRLL